MRRIKEAFIKYISLVPRGANRLPVIYKQDGNDEGYFDVDTLIKSDMDNGELTAVVYAPEVRDAQGDIASAKVIKDMMYHAAKNGLAIDIRHDEKPLPKDQVYVAESFIVQKADERFAAMKDYNGKPVDVTGAWAVVIKVDDANLRTLYKEGKWNGVSMGGRARVEAETSELTEKVLKGLAQRLGLNTGEEEMKPEELEAAINKSVTAAIPTIVDAVAAKIKPPVVGTVETKKADDAAAAAVSTIVAPVFKGNMSNPADIKKHATAVKLYNIAKAVDWNDPVSVEKYGEELAKINADGQTTTEAGKEEKDPEVARLEKELAAAQKRSNQVVTEPAKSGTATTTGAEANLEGMTKEDIDCATIGKKMADAMNAKRTAVK